MGVLIISKVALALFAVIFTAIGVCCFLVVPDVVFNKILEKTYLGRYSNGTYNELLQSYIHPPYHMQMEIWTLSVANADNVTKHGDKPHLVQKGPYTFLETQDKIVQFKDGTNDTRLYYRNRRRYFFSQSMSCQECLLTDKVTVPSLVFQKIVDFTKNNNFLIRESINVLLKTVNETVYTTVKVGDLLFDGYRDPLISAVCEYNKLLRSICKFYSVPEHIGLFYGGHPLNYRIKFFKMTFFMKTNIFTGGLPHLRIRIYKTQQYRNLPETYCSCSQNNTDDGLYEIDTGRADVHDIDRIFAWNGMAGRLNDIYWFGDEARMINGTDSQLFAPKELLKRKNFQIFAGQACRSIEMEYQGPTDVQDLPANRYSPAKSMSDMALQRHMGFCSPNTPTFFDDSAVQLPGCLPTGFMDMGGCMPGAPRIYTSNSHFLGAPPAVRAALVGMDEPIEAEDSVYVDIEPLTGVVVRGLRRSQINVGVLAGKLPVTSKMRPATIVPMVWINESVIFDPHTRKQLIMVTDILRYANIAGVCSIILSVALFAGFLLLIVISGRRVMPFQAESTYQNANVDTSFFDNEADT